MAMLLSAFAMPSVSNSEEVEQPVEESESLDEIVINDDNLRDFHELTGKYILPKGHAFELSEVRITAERVTKVEQRTELDQDDALLADINRGQDSGGNIIFSYFSPQGGDPSDVPLDYGPGRIPNPALFNSPFDTDFMDISLVDMPGVDKRNNFGRVLVAVPKVEDQNGFRTYFDPLTARITGNLSYGNWAARIFGMENIVSTYTEGAFGATNTTGGVNLRWKDPESTGTDHVVYLNLFRTEGEVKPENNTIPGIDRFEQGHVVTGGTLTFEGLDFSSGISTTLHAYANRTKFLVDAYNLEDVVVDNILLEDVKKDQVSLVELNKDIAGLSFDMTKFVSRVALDWGFALDYRGVSQRTFFRDDASFLDESPNPFLPKGIENNNGMRDALFPYAYVQGRLALKDFSAQFGVNVSGILEGKKRDSSNDVRFGFVKEWDVDGLGVRLFGSYGEYTYYSFLSDVLSPYEFSMLGESQEPSRSYPIRVGSGVVLNPNWNINGMITYQPFRKVNGSTRFYSEYRGLEAEVVSDYERFVSSLRVRFGRYMINGLRGRDDQLLRLNFRTQYRVTSDFRAGVSVDFGSGRPKSDYFYFDISDEAKEEAKERIDAKDIDSKDEFVDFVYQEMGLLPGQNSTLDEQLQGINEGDIQSTEDSAAYIDGLNSRYWFAGRWGRESFDPNVSVMLNFAWDIKFRGVDCTFGLTGGYLKQITGTTFKGEPKNLVTEYAPSWIGYPSITCKF